MPETEPVPPSMPVHVVPNPDAPPIPVVMAALDLKTQAIKGIIASGPLATVIAFALVYVVWVMMPQRDKDAKETMQNMQAGWDKHHTETTELFKQTIKEKDKDYGDLLRYHIEGKKPVLSQEETEMMTEAAEPPADEAKAAEPTETP